MSNKRGVAEGVQFQLPPGQERDDILGVTALFLGIGGLMMRHKPISWLALVVSLLSWMNKRDSQSDTRQILGGLSFSVMGLTLLYMQQGI